MPQIPEHLANLEAWESSRRRFVKSVLLAGVALQIPIFTSCSNITFKGNVKVSDEQASILNLVLNKLWPDDGNGPSIKDLNTQNYILNLLLQEEKHKYHNKFIVEGIDWANETSKENLKADILNLSSDELDKLMEIMIEDEYGSKWCSVLITYTYESLILDPEYGAQPNEVGWTWLGHTPGSPRPDSSNNYDALFKMVNDEV
ncbi:MAG: gluconate 2-dehydrogenase subunit 3 family protein [Crocinitomicaceae bacterium]|nr:gluconate 2-dehydrogenase subunit 3 family protein [Crocinitomicaceae bacterium]